jgi:hypothetical protein
MEYGILTAESLETPNVEMNNDEMVVKTVWKSAHAVRDWPGMVTIRRFSPFKNEKIEGATEADAWKNVADKIRAIWKPEWIVDVITSEQQAIADEADWQARVDEKEKERRRANRKADR